MCTHLLKTVISIHDLLQCDFMHAGLAATLEKPLRFYAGWDAHIFETGRNSVLGRSERILKNERQIRLDLSLYRLGRSKAGPL